jgi:hypothetical protein
MRLHVGDLCATAIVLPVAAQEAAGETYTEIEEGRNAAHRRAARYRMTGAGYRSAESKWRRSVPPKNPLARSFGIPAPGGLYNIIEILRFPYVPAKLECFLPRRVTRCGWPASTASTTALTLVLGILKRPHGFVRFNRRRRIGVGGTRLA